MRYIFGNKLSVIFVVVSSMMLLSACGGGGGGGGAAVTPRSASSPSLDVDTQAALTKAQAAAQATPNEGSVVQSSNVVAGITTDSISTSATFSNGDVTAFSFTRNANGGTPAISLGLTNLAEQFTATDLPGLTDESAARFIKDPAGTDTTFLGIDAFAARLGDTTDYLTAGYWLYSPDATADNPVVEIGAFADGTEAALTPSNYLTPSTATTATYSGGANGLYWTGVNGGLLDADVELTARLSSAPTIEGKVFNIQSSRDFNIDNLGRLPGNPEMMLQRALIDRADAGGFFTGNTLLEGTVDGTDYRYTGKWGGQFYGAEADAVIGTFGGSDTDDPTDTETFVGAFVATKRP